MSNKDPIELKIKRQKDLQRGNFLKRTRPVNTWTSKKHLEKEYETRDKPWLEMGSLAQG